jgi:hypothetical protein
MYTQSWLKIGKENSSEIIKISGSEFFTMFIVTCKCLGGRKTEKQQHIYNCILRGIFKKVISKNFEEYYLLGYNVM